MTRVDQPPPRTPRWVVVAGGAAVPAILLIAWWVVSAARVVSPRLLPSPQDVVVAAVELVQSGALGDDLAASLLRVLLGFAAGSLVGLLGGALLRMSRAARILLSPLIAALRAVPTVAWLPVLLLYLGVGETPRVVLIAIGTAFPIIAALTTEPDARLAIVRGLRTALSLSWVLLVTAELLHATAGIGFLLVDASKDGRADRVLVGIVAIVILARFTDTLMARLERRVLRRSAAA